MLVDAERRGRLGRRRRHQQVEAARPPRSDPPLAELLLAARSRSTSAPAHRPPGLHQRPGQRLDIVARRAGGRASADQASSCWAACTVSKVRARQRSTRIEQGCGRRVLDDMAELLEQSGRVERSGRAAVVDLGAVEGPRTQTPMRSRPGSRADLGGERAGQRRGRPRPGRRESSVMASSSAAVSRIEPGDHALGVHADGRVGRGADHHPPAGRLETDETALRGRDPDRAGDVVGVGGRHEAGRHRGRRTARRTAWRAVRGPTGCGSGRRRRARSCPSAPARARWSGRAG